MTLLGRASTAVAPLLLFGLAAPASAQQVQIERIEIQRLADQIAEQERLLAEQARLLAEQQAQIDTQRRKLEALEAQFQEPPARPAEGFDAVPRIDTAEAGTLRAGQLPETPVGEAPPEEEPDIAPALFLDDFGGGVLTPRGRLTLEPSIEYAHASTNRFIFRGVEILPAFLIGVIDITEARRDQVFGNFTARLGVTDRIEVEARVPYVYRSDRLRTTVRAGEPDEQVSVRDLSADGIGDIEVAGRYQINRGFGGWPIFVGNLRFKSATGTSPFDVARDAFGLETELPTGSGFFGLEPSVTVIYPTDPAVFFGGLGYLWNMPRSVDVAIAGQQIGRVNPGDAVRANFGMGFAINEAASFSLGYEHSYILRTVTEIDGVDTESDSVQVGSFLFGLAYRLNQTVGVNLALGIGVTEDAPDMRVSVRVPISIGVF